jgi:uncharacterized protein
MNSQLSEQVMAVFQEIDGQIATFQEATGLHCPPGCGKCCQSSIVEVTVLDCLPYAIEAWQCDQADTVLAQLADPDVHQCIFYQADSNLPGNGRCGIYAWRPALCRLFGFATVRNKQAQPELAACAEHKITQSDTIARIQPALQAGLAAPSFTEFAQQIAEIEPALGTTYLPINQAWQQAMERVGLWRQWEV